MVGVKSLVVYPLSKITKQNKRMIKNNLVLYFLGITAIVAIISLIGVIIMYYG